MHTTAWTEQEDQLLKDLMHQHLGARFKDIAEIATSEGGPLYGKRTCWAVQGHLSKITGRSQSRNKPAKETEDQETLLHQLQEENNRLKTENAILQKNLRETQDRLRIVIANNLALHNASPLLLDGLKKHKDVINKLIKIWEDKQE
jgi:regulator of replication initiation timing